MKDLTRREVLAGAAAGAALVTTGAHADEGRPAPIPQNVLGRTGQKIPRLLFGAAMPFGLPLLKAAYEQGVTYLDTADCYSGGASETNIGKFIAATGLRKNLWITTKSDAHDPAGLEKSLAQSLERLQTDHVDLLFLHNMAQVDKLSPEMKARVAALKKSGKIRFFGFSTHSATVVETLTHAAAVGWVDAIMFKYNFRAYGDDALNRAIDRAHGAEIGLIAMKTQASAFSYLGKVEPFTTRGFNKYQAALKGTWEDDRITAAVSEMGSVQALEENAAAARDTRKLGARVMEQMHRYADATEHLYCRGCDHVCTAGMDRPAAIADTLRFLMYHDEYGARDRARELFRQLPDEAKDAARVDVGRIAAQCPHRVDVAALLARAHDVLAG